MTRLAKIGSYVFGALGVVQFALGVMIAMQSNAFADTDPAGDPTLVETGGKCTLTSAGCGAGTCTTAATDCKSAEVCQCAF